MGRLKNGVSHLKLKVSELTWRAELNLLNDLFIKYFNTQKKDITEVIYKVHIRLNKLFLGT